jgi:uncharacterized protein
MQTRILVFVKAAQAGAVKTRLARAIGSNAAAQLYRRLAEHCVRCALESAVGEVVLCATPTLDDEFLRQLATQHRLPMRLQSGDDLGARMAEAIAWSSAGGTPSLLIGSDCAALTKDYLRDAAKLLAQADAVLGPAEDGGYFLIGLRRAQPSVFEGVEWSSAQVLARTRAKLAAAGLAWHELAPIWDVDEPADLERLAHVDAFPIPTGPMR